MVILSVNLQFVKYVFGLPPFSDSQYRTIKITRVKMISFTLVPYVQVAIFL
jgi:hypothetical protein